MKRLMLFMPVLIVAIALFAFASRTEQGSILRADVRKRMARVRHGTRDMAASAVDTAADAQDVAAQDVAVEVETASI
jgi:hypothetical protein